MDSVKKPAYTEVGHSFYLNLECFCAWCGFQITYDGAEDNPEENVIHMPGEGGYPDVAAAGFGLAQRLAMRLYRLAERNPALMTHFHLPAPFSTERITEEMIVNTWANFYYQYAMQWGFAEWNA